MSQVVVRRPTVRQVNPPDQGSGFLPVFLLSAFCTLAAAAGISRLTELAFFVSLLLAGLLHLVKVSLLPWHESTVGGGNRTAGYLGIAFITVPLTAFGLYGIGSLTGKDSQQLPRSESHQLRLVEPALAEPKLARPTGEHQFRDELLDHDEDSAEEEKPLRQQQMGSQTPVLRNQLQFEPWENNERPKVNRLMDEPSSRDSAPGEFQSFVNETLSRKTMALVCWLVPLIIEAIIFAVVLFNRPHVFYDYYGPT